MFSKSKIVGSLLGLGFFLVLTPTIGLAEAVRPCGIFTSVVVHAEVNSAYPTLNPHSQAA